ncbi:hypothetical protein D3C73_1309190 [compost metagenome]
METALQTRQSVVVPVPENGGPHTQFPLNGSDGIQEALVLNIQQARKPNVEDGGVQVRAVVRHGVGRGG